VAAYEVLLLNTAIPQIQAAQTGDTYVVPRDIAINATAIISANSATDALRITQTGAGNALVVEDSSNPDATPFVVTAAGNVGIGTNAPDFKMVVAGDADTRIRVDGSSSAGIYFTQGGSNAGTIRGATSGFEFYVPSTGLAATLNSAGNLGLGVPPSAWNAGGNIIEVGSAGNILFGTTSATGLTRNASYISGWKYQAAVAATYYEQYAGTHAWYRSTSTPVIGNDPVFSQAMTLDASGNLVVGATSTSYRMEVVAPSGDNITALFRSGDATAGNNAGGGFRNISSATAASRQAQIWLDADGANFSGLDYFFIQKNGNSGTVNFVQASNAAMTFATNDAERARITSGGYFKAQGTSSYFGSSGLYHELIAAEASDPVVVVYNKNGSFTGNMIQGYSDRTPSAGTYRWINFQNGGVTRFQVLDTGDCQNANNSYAGTSDEKLKQDIVDSGSQWDDVKNLRVRKFRFKSDPDGQMQIGLVAQEVETVSPGLVIDTPDYETLEVQSVDADGNLVMDADGNPVMDRKHQPTGSSTKAVKYSVLYMKSVKALQEAMSRIETLEAKIAALEAK
jgi:hypothetical protein